jgi:anti-sigma regulatory factor (Ser/Thr protein kinase)
MRVMWFFAPEPGSVAAARRNVADALADLPEEVLDPVLLMVSELVTNAVVHARTACTLVVERTADDIRVEVRDDGPGEAEKRTAGPADSSGRGLHIIDSLADKWAVIREPARDGKTVWFGVSLSPAPQTEDLPTITGGAAPLPLEVAGDAAAAPEAPPADDQAAPAGS